MCSIDIAVTELLSLKGQKSRFSISSEEGFVCTWWEVLKTAIFENKVPWAMKDGKIGAVVISRVTKADDVQCLRRYMW